MARAPTITFVLGMIAFMGITLAQEKAGEPEDRNERTGQRLSKTIKVSFEDKSFAEIVSLIGDACDVDIVIERKKLQACGIEPDTKLTLKLRQPLSGEATLRVLYRLMEADLETQIEEGIAFVTAKPAPEKPAMLTATFDLSDLVRRRDDADKPIPPEEQYEEIAQMVREFVSAECWRDNGGTCTLRFFNSRLIVRAPEDVHTEVAKFLLMLRNKPQ